MIDSLCDQAGGKDAAVVGLYCDFLAQKEQSAASMLGAILKQLVSRGGIPEYIRQALQKAKKEFSDQGLQLPDLVRLLRKTIAPLERVFICIDALDESAPRSSLSHYKKSFRCHQTHEYFSPGGPIPS